MGIRNKGILWIELTKFFKISQASIFPSFAIFLNFLQLPALENRRSLSMGLRIFRSIFYLVTSSFAVSPNFSFSELLLFYEFSNYRRTIIIGAKQREERDEVESSRIMPRIISRRFDH